MRSFYPGYQSKTEEDFSRLWADCTFAFDASALLDLYRLTPETREQFFTVLERAKERLWLPNQAGMEYYDNRPEVIRTGMASSGKIAQFAKDAANEFRKSLDVYRQYRWIEADRWAGFFDKAATEISNLLGREFNPLCDYLRADPVEQRLTELFHERVGKPFVDMHEVYARADKRLQLSVPPGFADVASKKDFHKYGDVVLWFQLLDFAKTEHRNIIFITSDAKKDWWLLGSGKTVGPRPELVQEMYAAAGACFHMYAPHRFLEYAPKYLNLQEKAPSLQKAAEELQQVEAEKAADVERTRLHGQAIQHEIELAAQMARMMREQPQLIQREMDLAAQMARMMREQPQLIQHEMDLAAQMARMMWEQLQPSAEIARMMREQLQPSAEPMIKSREQVQAMAEPNVELNGQLRKATQPVIQVTANAPATADAEQLPHEVERAKEQQREHDEADPPKAQRSCDGGGAEKDKAR